MIAWFNDHREDRIAVEQDAIGGAAWDLYGVPLADETLERAKASDCVLLGAVYLALGSFFMQNFERRARQQATLSLT